MKIAAVLSIVLIFLVGCGGDLNTIAEPISTPASAQSGKYLFAVVYENHALGSTKKGLVIQGNGDVYAFDVSATSVTLPESDTSSETELTRFFEAARFEYAATVQVNQLNYYRNIAQTLSNKTIVDASTSCRDAGVYKYLAFQAITSSNYRNTLVYQTGDTRRVQSDVRAEPLKDFLMGQAVLRGIVMQSEDEKENWCIGQ